MAIYIEYVYYDPALLIFDRARDVLEGDSQVEAERVSFCCLLSLHPDPHTRLTMIAVEYIEFSRTFQPTFSTIL